MKATLSAVAFLLLAFFSKGAFSFDVLKSIKFDVNDISKMKNILLYKPPAGQMSLDTALIDSKLTSLGKKDDFDAIIDSATTLGKLQLVYPCVNQTQGTLTGYRGRLRTLMRKELVENDGNFKGGLTASYSTFTPFKLALASALSTNFGVGKISYKPVALSSKALITKISLAKHAFVFNPGFFTLGEGDNQTSGHILTPNHSSFRSTMFDGVRRCQINIGGEWKIVMSENRYDNTPCAKLKVDEAFLPASLEENDDELRRGGGCRPQDWKFYARDVAWMAILQANIVQKPFHTSTAQQAALSNTILTAKGFDYDD